MASTLTPARWRVAGALIAALAAAGCNSDEVFADTEESTSTTVDKTPSTSLPETTDEPVTGPGTSTGPVESCRDIIQCLSECIILPVMDPIFDSIDRQCAVTCVGGDDVTLEELLWGVDLALCASGLCADEPSEMDTDTDTGGFKCDGGQLLDLSNECLECILLHMIKNKAPVGCEDQYMMCM